jgi:hypothetical protein
MQEAVNYVEAHGGELVRLPGGFWVRNGAALSDCHYGTPTVQALVSRGVATYSEWQEGRYGRFPIRMTLTRKDAQ